MSTYTNSTRANRRGLWMKPEKTQPPRQFPKPPGRALEQTAPRQPGVVNLQKEDVSGFRIDAAITVGKGHRQGLVGRELTKWTPEPGDEGMSLDTWEGAGWDQFDVNYKLFGVETTYDENLYTSALDKTKCRITEEEACRIARDIQRGSANNRHVREERGIDQGDQVSEEDRYSSVVSRKPFKWNLEAAVFTPKSNENQNQRKVKPFQWNVQAAVFVPAKLAMMKGAQSFC